MCDCICTDVLFFAFGEINILLLLYALVYCVLVPIYCSVASVINPACTVNHRLSCSTAARDGVKSAPSFSDACDSLELLSGAATAAAPVPAGQATGRGEAAAAGP